MLGICLGHQIIAQALGGTVVKSDKGWGLGVHEYKTTQWPGNSDPFSGVIRIQAYHQDQVVTIPDNAKVIAHSGFCENAAIWYPGFAITVQGHPEMSGEFVNYLLECRRGTYLTDQDVDRAKKKTLRITSRRELAEYLRYHLVDV